MSISTVKKINPVMDNTVCVLYNWIKKSNSDFNVGACH